MAIDSAKWYLANTTEGTQPGEYTNGTKATLQTALTAGQAVLANTSSTQAQITAAAANLNAAIAAYKSWFNNSNCVGITCCILEIQWQCKRFFRKWPYWHIGSWTCWARCSSGPVPNLN